MNNILIRVFGTLDQPTIHLPKCDKQIHFLLQHHLVLGVSGPKYLVGLSRFDGCPTRVLCAPLALESKARPFVREVSTEEKVVENFAPILETH